MLNRMIKVLASHSLSPKRQLTVVEVAGRTLLLGVTDQSINLITEFTDTEELVRLINPPAVPAEGFATILKKFGRGGGE